MRKTPFRHVTILSIFLLSVLLFSSAPLRAADAQAPTHAYPGEFFIVTSVNQRMHELFLKAPTEVTELMMVSDKTVFLDPQGKPITFKDLRAGDTVYVVSSRSSSGEPVATRIQIGPMTAAILHSRYLK